MNNYSSDTLGEKILLESNQNVFFFEFEKIEVIKNFEISYNISIDETYSDSCNLSFIFNDCYHSCAECSLSKEYSNITSHNCIECKDHYFHFPKESTNCFSEEEMKNKNISYFLDYNNKTFFECYSECLTCNGPSESDCLSCRNKSLLIYNGKCLAKYSNGTFITSNTNKQQESKNCSINCDVFEKENSTLIIEPNISITENFSLEIEQGKLKYMNLNLIPIL